MIKDILVNLTMGAGRDAAARFAISIGAAFEAHIVGVAFAYDPVISPTVMDGLSAAWIDTRRSENLAAAQAAINQFDNAARRHSAGHRLIEASLGGAAAMFGRVARRFDLAVVAQVDPGRTEPDDLFIEAALFDSGRPVVVVPYIQKDGLKLDRVLLCWDASRSASRAIADAMPFLRRGKTIDVVMVTDDRDIDDELPGSEIGEHLARHGLAVEVNRLVAGDLDVASMILSYAADCAADFIVMGGYGHSRLREFILGGVTRSILEQMTAPTLMSH